MAEWGEKDPWMVSLHGGHSGEFCDHAEGTLREMLEAAVRAGYHTFGVSEHVPRGEERFLYPEERERGWDLAKIEDDFERYAAVVPALAAEFADRLVVLRGFEAEVVPSRDYVKRTQDLLNRTDRDGNSIFDYFVGSVHYVNEIQIDGSVEAYRQATEACGGPQALILRYYETVAELVDQLRPPVVGHLDLIKKNLRAAGFDSTVAVDAEPVRRAARHVLEAVRAHNCILDLNTAGWRKGLGEPYPAPWLVEEAHSMGISFCFGDDSHRPGDVGAGVHAAREYLVQLGVSAITILTRERGDREIVRRSVGLV